jgi:membrane protease YdiL (CAAX protease family)
MGGLIRAGRGWLRRQVTDPIAEEEAKSREAMAARADRRIDGRVLIVCVVVAVDLTLLQYFGLSDRVGWAMQALQRLGFTDLASTLENRLIEGANARLYALFYWAFSCVVCYLVIPALVVKLVLRQSLADYGLRFRGALRHLKVYVVLYALVLPAVIAVSFSQRFQEQYPFYKDYALRIPPGFLWWEVAYAAQFFALEFFFRGFMVHGLKRRFGFYAVPAMCIPYCMIHFGKPFPETLGAIVAGLVLGFLSLRTGTIWLGFLIHVSVALTMDIAALWQQGLL